LWVQWGRQDHEDLQVLTVFLELKALLEIGEI
jgi:hypothetical protein